MDIYKRFIREGIRINSEGQIHKDDVVKLEKLLIGDTVLDHPQLISGADFPLKKILENENSNRKMYEELMGKSKKKEVHSLAPNGQLFKLGNKLFLVDNSAKEIVYYVQYELKHFKKILTVTQIAVWLQYLSDYVNMPSGDRVSKYVFFDILLPLADAIMTDALQTEDGSRFWMNRTREAISKGMHVYAVFKDKNLIKKIESISDLKRLKDEIWGREAAKENRKLLISEKELFNNL
jgi:hypothetical protein